MPALASYTYPGVYVNEVDSNVHTITGVATSITAFVGHCLKGPVNEPTQISSFTDFERIFGGLWLGSYLGFSVRDFYLNGGSQAVIVRVFQDISVTIPTQTGNKLTLIPAPGSTWSDSLTIAVSNDITKKSFALTITPSEKDKLNTQPETLTSLADISGSKYIRIAGPLPSDGDNPTTTATPVTLIRGTARVALPCTPPILDIMPITKPVSSDDSVQNTKKTQSKIIETTATNDPPSYLILETINPGDWGNSLQVVIEHYLDDAITKVVAEQYHLKQTDLFKLKLLNNNTGELLESFNYFSVIPNIAVSIDKILANNSQYIRMVGPLPPFIPDETKNSMGESPVSFDGGSNGSLDPKVNTDAVLGSQYAKTGMYALEKTDLFNLLYIPGYNTTQPFPDRVGYPADTDTNVLKAAAEYCQKRNAFLIIDPPTNWQTKDSAKTNGIPSLNIDSEFASYAAVFFPLIQQANPLRNYQMEQFLPGGMIAGTFARIDAQRGVWKAPAGLEAQLSGLTRLDTLLTDNDNGDLNPLGINCLRVMPNSGAVIWGARTLAGDDRLNSDWKYIPVRRLALYLEMSLYRGTQWVVFEPNDESLWRQIVVTITSFMDSLFKQGAFQGQSAQQAYFVKCDSTTTTQRDIDNGIVNIVVGFAPVKPAEFVVITIQQMAEQN